ncbi:hypothetical protein IW262DRAFT_1301313 [Armillaria fumosa]|nr:hypothetical protein IW262DRAFT_1301313 [Armillaria fumosa]
MFITLLIISTTYLTVMLGSDNHGDNGLPPTRPGSPHDWPNTVNPGWGSTWRGNWGSGNWGTSSSLGSNTTIGAPGLPQHIQPPMWPRQFYSQHPNAGPPGFYPPNWGGYAYLIVKPLLVIPKTAQAELQVSKSKGKKKASNDELLRIAKEEEDYQAKAKQLDVEDEPIPPELEQELARANKGTKRPLSLPREGPSSEMLSKQRKQPPMGPSTERQVLAAAEGRSMASKPTKNCKKDVGKTRQLTVLPQRIEYLALRDGAAYLRDSRVHNGTIHEGSSVDEWISFLTGSMGIKPTHPDEPQPASTDTGESGSECSDEDEDDDDEPWHVKWHRANLLPKNTPDYKQHERSIFLKVKQEKFDRRRNDHRIHEYNTALAWWEAQPGRRPPSLPSAYNIVLANTEVANTVQACDNDQGLRPPVGMNQRNNPRGFPMSIREMHGMVVDIRNRQPRWRNDLYLLSEFYRISLSGSYDRLTIPLMSGVGISLTTCNPEAAALHLGLEWTHRFKSASLILGGARSAYSQIFAGIVARPQWYSIWIAEMNVACPQAPVEISSSTNILEHMEWDGSGWDMDEDDVIHHMAHNGLTQPMVDSAYPYGLTFIDRGLSTDSAHTEFYVEIDQRRHVLLDTYGVPPTIDAHQGWWYPDTQDLKRIRVLRHVQSYESTDKRTSNSGTTSTRPIYDWFHVGEHYVYEWLAECPPPSDAYHAKPMTGSPLLPRPVASLDEDVEMDNRSCSTGAGSLDTDITRLSIIIDTGGTAPAVDDVPATEVVSDEEMPVQTH